MFGKKKKENDVSDENNGNIINKNKEMIEQGLEIHTMPEKFLSGGDKASQAKKTGIIIFAFAGLFLVILIVILYVILFTASEPAENENISQSSKRDNSLETDESEKTNQSINKEKSDGNGNLIKDLIIDTDTAISTGSEEFLNEEVSTSTKDNQISTSTAETIEAEKDMDNDGLLASEESLLGTDPKSIDSDKDSYDDLSEILNLYNPAGSGRLVDNLGIDEYINSSYGYSVLHPSDWQMNILGSDDSIVFKSKNNHILQIYVQPNPKLKNIETWYEEQVGKKAENKNFVKLNNWKGILSDDGLVIYITDNNYNFIYTLLYIPEFEEEPVYKNIFQTMINSFVIKNL